MVTMSRVFKDIKTFDRLDYRYRADLSLHDIFVLEEEIEWTRNFKNVHSIVVN